MPWAEAAERVELLANGLLARGVQKGDAFGMLARNTLEWALFDFALGHVGAIEQRSTRTPRPTTCTTSSSTPEAVGVLCEDDEQRAKVEGERSSLPALRRNTYTGLPALEDEGEAYRK